MKRTRVEEFEERFNVSLRKAIKEYLKREKRMTKRFKERIQDDPG